ncbi:MAG: response regulator [Armatimonadetes bacterium]|nr:response regulator [Armatimonadota bacterium]MDW8121835.1 response regulator [Armatimonadota bacterium]
MPARILVVDDEDIARVTISDLLTRDGHEVVQASDGRRALEMFIAHKPDLVILDVMLPELDGYEVCEQIRSMPEPYCKVPIILLSGINTILGRRTGLEAGADVYLAKPFDPKELRLRVRSLLKEAG